MGENGEGISAWMLMVSYPGDGLVAPHGSEGAWQSKGGPPGASAGCCAEKKGSVHPKRDQAGSCPQQPGSVPAPAHAPPPWCSAVLLKSTSYRMGADSYLFIKLFWNRYSTTNLSCVFFRKNAFIERL